MYTHTYALSLHMTSGLTINYIDYSHMTITWRQTIHSVRVQYTIKFVFLYIAYDCMHTRHYSAAVDIVIIHLHMYSVLSMSWFVFLVGIPRADPETLRPTPGGPLWLWRPGWQRPGGHPSVWCGRGQDAGRWGVDRGLGEGCRAL